MIRLGQFFKGEEKVQTGTVKFFNREKGFGFITRSDDKDIFFHVSEIQGQEPMDGDKVEFGVGSGKKGPCAIEVRVVQ